MTTDKCYEPNSKKRFKENDKLGGDDIYSASKACAEIITKAYFHSFFDDKKKNLKIATVRAGNVIGPGDFGEHRLIPDIIRSVNNNKVIKIYNKLDSKNPPLPLIVISCLKIENSFMLLMLC